MKYNLRFFHDAKDFEDARCFASFRSRHVPNVGSIVSLAEDSDVYKVKRRIFVYEKNPNGGDECVSVEVFVKAIIL